MTWRRKKAEVNPGQTGWASGPNEATEAQEVETEKRRLQVQQIDEDVPPEGYENAENPAQQVAPYKASVMCAACGGTGRVASDHSHGLTSTGSHSSDHVHSPVEPKRPVARVVVPASAEGIVGAPVYLSNGASRIGGRVTAMGEDDFSVEWSDGQETVEKKSDFDLVVKDQSQRGASPLPSLT